MKTDTKSWNCCIRCWCA